MPVFQRPCRASQPAPGLAAPTPAQTALDVSQGPAWRCARPAKRLRRRKGVQGPAAGSYLAAASSSRGSAGRRFVPHRGDSTCVAGYFKKADSVTGMLHPRLLGPLALRAVTPPGPAIFAVRLCFFHEVLPVSLAEPTPRSAAAFSTRPRALRPLPSAALPPRPAIL